ncbi:hypothetical protein [Halobacillus kuroshimensis]|uniref:hypothetical protein n=1 Tax=Halobacillus kuroshimensis TaxID=302481 RepID=UPI0012EC976E|nr:hypothetical protein [Halobacillus kuroshimensis]
MLILTNRLSMDVCRGHGLIELGQEDHLTKWIYGSRCSRRRHHRTLIVESTVSHLKKCFSCTMRRIHKHTDMGLPHFRARSHATQGAIAIFTTNVKRMKE